MRKLRHEQYKSWLRSYTIMWGLWKLSKSPLLAQTTFSDPMDRVLTLRTFTMEQQNAGKAYSKMFQKAISTIHDKSRNQLSGHICFLSEKRNRKERACPLRKAQFSETLVSAIVYMYILSVTNVFLSVSHCVG